MNKNDNFHRMGGGGQSHLIFSGGGIILPHLPKSAYDEFVRMKIWHQ